MKHELHQPFPLKIEGTYYPSGSVGVTVAGYHVTTLLTPPDHEKPKTRDGEEDLISRTVFKPSGRSVWPSWMSTAE